MESIATLIKNTPEAPVDASLHSGIMSAIVINRLLYKIQRLTILVGVAFALSSWHVMVRWVTADVQSIVKLGYADFEWSFDYIRDFALIIGVIIPKGATFVFVANLTVGVYVVRVMRSLKKSYHSFAHFSHS